MKTMVLLLQFALLFWLSILLPDPKIKYCFTIFRGICFGWPQVRSWKLNFKKSFHYCTFPIFTMIENSYYTALKLSLLTVLFQIWHPNRVLIEFCIFTLGFFIKSATNTQILIWFNVKRLFLLILDLTELKQFWCICYQVCFVNISVVWATFTVKLVIVALISLLKT